MLIHWLLCSSKLVVLKLNSVFSFCLFPSHLYFLVLGFPAQWSYWIHCPYSLYSWSQVNTILTRWKRKKRPSFVPQCLLSSLEALEWRGYTGRAGDKDLMSYLLTHALCLKTAKIFYKSYPRDVRNQQIEDYLASTPRGSNSCELVCEVMEWQETYQLTQDILWSHALLNSVEYLFHDVFYCFLLLKGVSNSLVFNTIAVSVLFHLKLSSHWSLNCLV